MNTHKTEKARGILISTTIGPVDSGIIDALIDAYTDQNPQITVRYMARGTGKAIELARGGNIDMVIVHAKTLEEKFVADGCGIKRIDFMYNDYVLAGPKNDPADVANAASIVEALQRIHGQHRFVSRGDQSGTHIKELELWEQSGIHPDGNWYEIYENGSSGNRSVLLHADAQNAYTLIDRATMITTENQLKNTNILYEKDEIMLNYISLIPCNPEKFSHINAADTADLIQWLTGPEAQKLIEEFGVAQYGKPIFFPNAK